MAEVDVSTVAANAARLNVVDRLGAFAAQLPDGIAVACPRRHSTDYATITFAELDSEATRIARGLVAWGVKPGSRIALLVRPGIEFVTLVFALLRTGVVIVLVDPGLGRRNLVRCLAETAPDGFVAIPAAHAVRMFVRGQFPHAKWNVTVGRRWFWGGLSLEQLRERGETAHDLRLPETQRPTRTPAPRSPLPAPCHKRR
jgi:acyl-CoA synthetase (AMP-forming)/AMP-acid ligase II